MKKFALPSLIFMISATIALYNIGHFPKMIGDEGIYVAQAWWLAHFGQLGPYTYWYDHFPLGWAQIGVWQLLVGPTSFLQSSVITSRIFMGIILGGTSTITYLLTYRLTKSVWNSLLASIIFITSTLTLTFGRMVLLDNIAVFWFLLSLLLVISSPRRLRNLIFSAVTLSLAILSKESLLFFLPPYLFIINYLNKENPHKKYAILTSSTTIFFLLSFFPLLSVLKGELFPAVNQVSFLNTLLYQAGRGSGLPFWMTGSHFREMLSIWVSIDPVLIFLGSISILIVPFLNSAFSQKFVTMFILFFFFFLIRGGQIYDFYIIPLLPLLSINISILINYFENIVKSKILSLILLGSLLTYFFTNSLYLFATDATKNQLDATSYLKQLPEGSLIVANNYSYLDLVIHGKNTIHWYQKVETDPSIQLSIGSISNILLDEQFSRELASNQLPFLKGQLNNQSIISAFGSPLSPGQIIKPYSTEYLLLYGKNKITQTTSYLVTLSNTDNLSYLKTSPPYGVLIDKNNFNNSSDLENLIAVLKANISDQTVIVITQDDTGSNTIPWITTPNRIFYKSAEEASLATSKKSEAIKDLGITGIVLTTSSDDDGYLQAIIDSASPHIIPILRFDGAIPKTKQPIIVNTPSDFTTLTNANYSGQILRSITLEKYLEI